MKKRFGIIFSLSLGLLSVNAALASDAVLGAIVGGGLGAVVGNHVSGRNGAVIGGAVGAAAGAVIASDGHRRRSTHYTYVTPTYAPAPIYAPVYAPGPVYYAAHPVRVVRAPVVYAPAYRGEWRHDHRNNHRHGRDRHDRHWR